MTARARMTHPVGLAGAITLLAWLLAPVPAVAATDTDTVQGRYLRIVSTADADAMAHLDAGDVVGWNLTISADAPDPGTIDIGVAGDGELRLVSDVLSCADAWRDDLCTDGEEVLRSRLPVPRDGEITPLLTTADTVTTHLRLEVSLAGGSSASQHTSTVVRVYASGMGETVAASPHDHGTHLPPTGIAHLPLGLLAGVLVIAAGIAAAAGGRRVRERRW